jgi:hypothetical protein
MSDFSKDTGDIQSSDSTSFDPIESGEPTTGFVQSPKAEQAEFGAGPGIKGHGRKIH